MALCVKESFVFLNINLAVQHMKTKQANALTWLVRTSKKQGFFPSEAAFNHKRLPDYIIEQVTFTMHRHAHRGELNTLVHDQ